MTSKSIGASIIFLLVVAPIVGLFFASVNDAQHWQVHIRIAADKAGLRYSEQHGGLTAEERLHAMQIDEQEREMAAEQFRIWLITGLGTLCLIAGIGVYSYLSQTRPG